VAAAGLFLSSTIMGLPAQAAGPGVYTVKGNNSDKSSYTGTLTIVQLSQDTYKLSWNIDGDKYEGFAIGSAHVMAATFSNKTDTGTALIVEDDEKPGGYKSIWGFKGDKEVGVEWFSPKK
jgi:hypothetical protein